MRKRSVKVRGEKGGGRNEVKEKEEGKRRGGE
jgi:hypothetical protein